MVKDQGEMEIRAKKFDKLFVWACWGISALAPLSFLIEVAITGQPSKATGVYPYGVGMGWGGALLAPEIPSRVHSH